MPLEFSKNGDERLFLSEFATDPDSIAITLATIGWINDWVIAIVSLAIASRTGRTGARNSNTKVTVSIAKVTKNGTTLKGIKIKGDSESVLHQLRELQENSGE